MASLTDNLPNATSSRRIIDPQNDKGPGFLATLAKVAQTAVTGGSRLYEGIQDDSARARANAEREQATRANAGAARLQFEEAGYDLQPNVPVPINPEPSVTPQPGYVPFDAELAGPPPAEVTQGVNMAVRARAAEQQGRAVTGSGQIVFRDKVEALLAQFPDRQDLVMAAFKEQGFTDIVFRERDMQLKEEDYNIETVRQGERTFADFAYKNGLVTPGAPLEQAVSAGQAWAKMESDFARGKQEADAAAARDAAEGRILERNQKEADRQSYDAAGRFISEITTPLFNQFQSLAIEAQRTGQDAAFNSATSEFSASIPQIVLNVKASLRARNMATPEALAQVDAAGKELQDNITNFLQGPASAFAINKRGLESAQTQLGLRLDEALPIYNGLKGLLGQQAANDILIGPGGIAGAFPPDVVAQIQGERRNIIGAIDTAPEKLSMQNIAQLLRGQTTINRLPEAAAMAAMPLIARVARSSQVEMNQNPTGANAQAYANSQINGFEAAMGLQPGQQQEGSGPRGLVVAAGTLFNATALQAAEKFISVDPEQGRLLVRGGRAAATNVLNGLKSTTLSSRETGNGIWTIQYARAGAGGANARVAGSWRAVLAPGGYERYVQSQRSLQGPSEFIRPSMRVLSEAELIRQGPGDLLEQNVGARNLAMNYLVATSKYDEDFKGVLPAEIRNMLGEGTLPRAFRERQQENSNFAERVAAFREDTNDAVQASMNDQIESTQQGNIERGAVAPPIGEVQTEVKTQFEGAGVPWDVAERLARKESGWRTDPGKNGSMVGLFQVKGGSRDWKQNVQQGLDHWLEAGRTAVNALGGRNPTPGEQYVAYQQGVGGGAALLNPRNANRLAWEVLAPMYPNERIAKQAVTGNMGNLNMTAAEFSRTIQDYFNR